MFTVTSLLDDGSAGTLRDAINQANTNPEENTIHFAVIGAINLNGAISLAGTLTIDGPGADLLTIRDSIPPTSLGRPGWCRMSATR